MKPREEIVAAAPRIAQYADDIYILEPHILAKTLCAPVVADEVAIPGLLADKPATLVIPRPAKLQAKRKQDAAFQDRRRVPGQGERFSEHFPQHCVSSAPNTDVGRSIVGAVVALVPLDEPGHALFYCRLRPVPELPFECSDVG